jgi:hypothetical protein
VRRAVREGLIEAPEGDEYLRGLVFGVAPQHSAWQDLESTYEGLLADPALLEREVWQLFEVDVGAELANANTWQQKDEGKPHEGYTRGDNRWLYALSRLADEQRLDRGRLLDASVDALMRDFRASTVGWYAKAHEELQPTRAERLERLDRYLALLTSPTPAVVKEGLAALREIEDAVPPEAFARVAPTPFTQRQKNLSMETLSMLARMCKRHSDALPLLLEAAAHALAHDRADVQERALRLLEEYADQVPRASLLAYVEVVSPTLQPRVQAVTGVAAAREDVRVEIPAPTVPRLTLDVVRATRPPLVRVESVDELIELAAMLLEGQGDGDDCERFLDGVSRLCDERPQGFERRTAGLVKRAEASGMWGSHASGTETIASVVQAWVRRARGSGPPAHRRTAIGFLARRAGEVAKRARHRRSRPLLSMPTHSGGSIEPEVLEERVRAMGRAFDQTDPIDRDQARVRVVPTTDSVSYRREVKTKSVYGQTIRGLRLACPSVPDSLGELAPIAAHAGAVETDPSSWYGVTGWAGHDSLGSRWALTVLPWLPEAAFAAAATAAVDARQGSSYQHPEVALEYALDQFVPLHSEAWLAVAACLVAKPSELPRVAADLLVASIDDGRYDAGALGEQVAWLVDNELAKANRLGAPLRDVARVSPLHAAQTLRACEAVLAHLDSRPRTLHALLEVAAENEAATGARIQDERARRTLEGIVADLSASSKLGRLARALLTS